MASKIGSLYYEIYADTNKLDAGLNKSKSGLNKLGDGFQKVTGVSLGTAGAIGLASVAIKKAIDYSKVAISAASDLAETESKVGVVFSDQADKMLAWGENTASAMGMSSNAALAAAGTYGNLFRAMGIGIDVSAEMSQTLVELAADLASFNNMDPTEVLDKLRAGLSGEVEPLRSLGVNLNQVIIQEKARELGLWDGIGALDAATKAQASYALIMEQTSLAQGDFKRTSEGLANQQRILKAESENLAAAIGESLLPLKTAWVKILGEVTHKTWELIEAKNREKRIIQEELNLIDSENDRFAELMEYYSGIGMYGEEAYRTTMNNLKASKAYEDSLKGQARAYYTLHPEIAMTAEQMEYLGISSREAAVEMESAADSVDKIQAAIDNVNTTLKSVDWVRAFSGTEEAAEKTGLMTQLIQDNLGSLGVYAGDVWNEFLLQTGQIDKPAVEAFVRIQAAFLNAKSLLASGLPVQVVVDILTNQIAGATSGLYPDTGPSASDWVLKGTKGGEGTQNAWWSESLGQWYYGAKPPGGATGLSMRVPPGYPNDSFLIGVTSGEEVNVGKSKTESSQPTAFDYNRMGEAFVEALVRSGYMR